MKYETLTYTNKNGESIVFGVNNLYHCNVSKDVTGLSGADPSVYSTSSIGQHGDTYTGMRIEPRTIKITGKIKAGGRNKDTQVTARRKLMRVLNPELAGTLRYEIGEYSREIGAILDDIPKINTEEIYPEFVISLKCLDPFWVEIGNANIDVATWENQWEFPWEITNEFEFSTREFNPVAEVQNNGDVSVGATICVTATGAVSGPGIYKVDTGEYIKLNYELQTGDVLVLCTEYGSKTAILRRDGSEIDVYRYLDVDSTFFSLDVGATTVQYTAENGLDNMDVAIQYKQRYVGV